MNIMYSLMNNINVLIIIYIVASTITGDISTLAQQSSIIETYPSLLNSTIVTGYEGLQLSVQIQSGVYVAGCVWHYAEMFSTDIFVTSPIQCISTSNDEFMLACDITNNVITSTLTILIPTRESVTVRVECQANPIIPRTETLASLNLNVKDCTSSLPLAVDSTSATYNSTGTFGCTNNDNLYYTNGTQATVPRSTCLATAKWSGEENVECFKGCNVTYPLVVDSNSTFYNSSGTFSCANNGTLFYSNGTQLTSTQTTCLATAEWSGQNGLGCGKAPNVVINGELMVIEDDDVTLTCDYVDVFPFGNTSAFHFLELPVVLDKGQSFSIPNLKRSDNNKPVSCRALTPFTQIYPETGRSDERSIKVLYAPYQDNPTSCAWLADLSQICKIYFYSNTNVTVQRITKDGSLVDGIVSPVSRDGDDLVSFQFGILKVTLSDVGSYQVQLSSIAPPYNHIIYFEIDVVENVCSQSSDGLFIGLICSVVYGVVVSILAVGIYFKLSKALKLKDERVYYEATTSKANNPISDGTYITIDDVKSSPAENNKPTEYLTPNEINSEATKPLPADGYENVIVAENEDVGRKRKPSTKASYENFAGSERKSTKTKNISSSKASDEYEIMNLQIAQK